MGLLLLWPRLTLLRPAAGTPTSPTAALAQDRAVRGLFRAALDACATRLLLPLANASRLSDVMVQIDPSWAALRRRYAPFSRLFWAYSADVAAAGLALVPACDGFALVHAHGGADSGTAAPANTGAAEEAAYTALAVRSCDACRITAACRNPRQRV